MRIVLRGRDNINMPMIDDEVIILSFREIEGKGRINTIQLNKLDNYDLPFQVKGAYMQAGSRSSNDILDKLKTNYNVQNNMVNQIVPSDQWDEEIMTHRLLKALAEGRVNLDEETTRKLVESLVAGRVRFVPAYSFAGLDIKNMKKFTIK